MSLTSYRTAPPRVTDFHHASDTRSELLNRFQRKARNDFAAHSGRHGRVHDQPAEPRLASGEDAKILKEALLSPCDVAALCIWLGRPGSDLLSRVLRHSTIGAGGLNDRVRNGIGWGTPARTTRSAKPNAYNNFRLIIYSYQITDLGNLVEVFRATCSSPRMGLES